MTITQDFNNTPISDRETNGLGSATRPAPAETLEDEPRDNLRAAVERSMERYLSQLGNDSSVTDLYQLVLSEVEAPLLEAVLDYTGSNQSRASIMLGLNRGTLRKKMKQHGLL
jgi:Fis family transcriptional regulator, factor for inversion stimulation protein